MCTIAVGEADSPDTLSHSSLSEPVRKGGSIGIMMCGNESFKS